jgi:CRISPR/Cas system CSM-associated protein Csm3 (group 7 of RAMP superfamily)
MSELRATLRVELLSGFHIQAGFGTGGLHQAMVRNAKRQPFIPASSLKGRLKFQAQRFANLLDVYGNEAMFESFELLFGGAFQLGRLYLDNAILVEDAHQSEPLAQEVRATNQIDRDTRTVTEGHLRFFETLPSTLKFETALRLVLPEARAIDGDVDLLPTECQTMVALLLGALRLCDQLGGGKTRGTGRIRLVHRDWTLAGKPLVEFPNAWFAAYLGGALGMPEVAS